MISWKIAHVHRRIAVEILLAIAFAIAASFVERNWLAALLWILASAALVAAIIDVIELIARGLRLGLQASRSILASGGLSRLLEDAQARDRHVLEEPTSVASVLGSGGLSLLFASPDESTRERVQI